MPFDATIWTFEKGNLSNILKVKAECPMMEFEPFLIRKAAEMIEKAGKFNGNPYVDTSLICTTSNCPISVSFSLIFPSYEKSAKFLKSLGIKPQ